MNTITRANNNSLPDFLANPALTDQAYNPSDIDETSEVQKADHHSEIISEKSQQFTQTELQLIEDLKKTDTKVKQHEMAHIAAGGEYITSGANFTYQKGPDGKNYAVAGEVGIDTSPVSGDPKAIIKKMSRVKNAALAPADPSSQDVKVAADATSASSKALAELMLSRANDQTAANEEKALGHFRKAADTYQKISAMAEKQTASFQITA